MRMNKKYRGAGFVFITTDDKVLLLKKTNGRWSLPGGRRNIRELPLDTATRETHEEIGMMPKGQIIMYIIAFSTDNCKSYSFIKRIDRSFIPKLSSEHIDYMWSSLKTCDKCRLTKTAKIILTKLIKRIYNN
jgi:hypothetical protein